MASAEDIKRTLASPFRAVVGDPIGTIIKGPGNSGAQIPDTKTKTSYALTLHAVVGNRRGVIGAVHEIKVNQTLQMDEEYEVDALARGLPRQLVPQLLTGRSLTLSRYDLYTQTMEQVFGSPELFTLLDQSGSVSMRFSWRSPGPQSVLSPLLGNNSSVRIYEFVDCWITSLGRTISTGNVIVGADATIMWRNIRPLQ